MKDFIDESGGVWHTSLVERTGPDYKARFSLQMNSADGAQTVTLEDVAWNSPHTARRTLETMSTAELRRRLRIGQGRLSSVRTP